MMAKIEKWLDATLPGNITSALILAVLIYGGIWLVGVLMTLYIGV